MGDRKGLTKLDRTNGFDDGRDYMRVKKSKLAQQNDQIRDSLRNRNNSLKTDIFKGISINVNGRTKPTADELKRLVLLHGGDYHPYYRYQTTKFMIATALSTARMKNLRPDDRVIRPEWITDSVDMKCLLPYEDYQLFADEARGKNGAVLGIEDEFYMLPEPGVSSATDLVPVAQSYRRNYRKKESQPIGKSRDIREMFKRTVCSSNSISNSLAIQASSIPITRPISKTHPKKGSQSSGKNRDIREMFKRTVCNLTTSSADK